MSNFKSTENKVKMKINKYPFKMETLKSALSMTRKGFFMASIDLTDAYYSVPIENSPRNFFAFQF